MARYQIKLLQVIDTIECLFLICKEQHLQAPLKEL